MADVFANAFPASGGGGEQPNEVDVRFGTTYGDKTGALRVPDPSEVLLGVLTDTTTGTYRGAGVGDVRSGVNYGALDALTGLLNLPAVGDVRDGVGYDNGLQLGILDLPAVGDVRLGTQFDDNQQTGTLDIEAEADHANVADVRLGTTYSGGNLVGTLAVPTASNVLLGVSVDQGTGTYRGNAVGDVRLGVAYGASDALTGTLDLPAVTDVRLGIQFDGTLQTGTLDLPPANYVLLGETFDNGNQTGTNRSPPQANVLLNYAYGPDDVLVGSLDPGVAGDVPLAKDVRDGVVYDNGGATGNLRVPDPNDVRSGVSYDSIFVPVLGTLNIDGEANQPSPNVVREGVTYGSINQLVGNSILPNEAQVLKDISYGSNGTEFTGTLDPGVTGVLPSILDVRFGVPFGTGQEGVLALPVEAQVQLGVGYGAYGTEFEGTLAELPGGSGQVLPPVLGSGQLRSPLCIGDSYLVANGNAFQWLIDPIAGMTIAAEVRFYGRKSCDNDCTGDIAWDVTANPVDQGEFWLLSLDMTSAESGVIPVGDYKWYLILSEGDTLVTIECGLVGWVCK